MSGRKKRRVQEKAAWLPDRNNRLFVSCSKCGFRIETVRAVETGWSSADHVALRYRFCPECGRPMSLYRQEEQRPAAAAAAAERENAVAGHKPESGTAGQNVADK